MLAIVHNHQVTIDLIGSLINQAVALINQYPHR